MNSYWKFNGLQIVVVNTNSQRIVFSYLTITYYLYKKNQFFLVQAAWTGVPLCGGCTGGLKAYIVYKKVLSGYYDILTKMVKDAKWAILKPLLNVINSSHLSGIIPLEL